MALTYDQISAITQKKFMPKLYDNIFEATPLLKRLKDKSYEKIDGGTSIIVPLNYAMTTATGWYAGADTLSVTDNDVITGAEYSWKQLYATIQVTGLDEKKNMGDSQILNFVKQKVQIAEKTMSDGLSTGIYNAGTDAKAIVGLQNIIGTSNTIGGISQSTYSWWQGKVDSTTTTLSMSALQTQYNAATVGNDHPTVAVAGRTIFNLYYALLQPQQRFMDSDTAKGGFQNLMFNGIPFITDSYVPSSNVMMVNEDYLSLYVHSQCDMKFEEFQKPVNQDVKSAKILWMGSFGSSNNRMHAKLSGITA